jgi:hypothetical protein
MADSKTKHPDEQVVFFMSEDRSLVLLGVPEKAWDYMADGKTHTFNLQSVGFPVQIMLYGGPTRAHIIDAVSAMMKGEPVLYNMKKDYSIPEDKQSGARMRSKARLYLLDYVGAGISDEWLDGLIQTIFDGAAGK